MTHTPLSHDRHFDPHDVQREPCYQPDCNAGHHPDHHVALSSADRSKLADKLGVSGLQALMQRIETAHQQVSHTQQSGTRLPKVK